MGNELKSPWLVATWPGMGGVAHIAGAVLVNQLGATPLGVFDASPFVEPQSVLVRDGLVQAAPPPSTPLFGWRNPAGGHDLVIFVADRQPATATSQYAAALLEMAARFGIERVVTFAAMATPTHPTAQPHVFGIATQPALLDELRQHGVTPLEDGEINGLNGFLIAAAAARGLPGCCLLGEFPFFAAQLPNPKASAAVLEVFGRMLGTPIDLESLRGDASRIEGQLVSHLESLETASDAATRPAPETAEQQVVRPADKTATRPRVPKAVLDRIEVLFEAARTDRAKALELKAELDRHDLFRTYEDRFLDLFKQAG